MLIAKQGPFGPYLEYGPKQYAPIKGFDPLSITLEDAAALVEAKIQAEADKIVKVFPDTDVKILKGRWGPYITDVSTKKNAKIQKDEDALALTLEECQKRLDEAPEPKNGAVAVRKSTGEKGRCKESHHQENGDEKTTAKKRRPKDDQDHGQKIAVPNRAVSHGSVRFVQISKTDQAWSVLVFLRPGFSRPDRRWR